LFCLFGGHRFAAPPARLAGIRLDRVHRMMYSLESMDAKASRALKIIQECMAARGRHRMTAHFEQRLQERVAFWPEVLSILDEPTEVRDGGPDEVGRPKWILRGRSTAGQELELVCRLESDQRRNRVVFVTIYEVSQ
jgi:hypothetical protein